MKNIERLASLTPGTTSIEPGRGSTAPALDLKGVEIAATLTGLTDSELLFVQVKYIGEQSEYDRLLEDIRRRCFVTPTRGIREWIERKPKNNREGHLVAFKKAIKYILDQHLGDYRCAVCNGTGYLYTFSKVCTECGGGGVNKLNYSAMTRAAGLKRGWAYSNLAPINECRDIIIRIENSAIQTINANSR